MSCSRVRLLALARSALNDLQRCYQVSGFIVERVFSGLDASDHPGFIVSRKCTQDFGKLVSSLSCWGSNVICTCMADPSHLLLADRLRIAVTRPVDVCMEE